MFTGFIDIIYSRSLSLKKEIIWGFITLYILLAMVLFTGGISVYRNDESVFFYHQVGLLAGKTALCVFILTLIPGIARRFTIKHKIISLLRIFRRYLGILVFMLVTVHSGMVAIIPRLPFLPMIVPFAVFELFGLSAYFILFFMFLTSNDLSMARLKIWWYRLHRLVYAALGLVFLHTSLQAVNTWSVLTGGTALVMVVSFIYEYRKKRVSVSAPS